MTFDEAKRNALKYLEHEFNQIPVFIPALTRITIAKLHNCMDEDGHLTASPNGRELIKRSKIDPDYFMALQRIVTHDIRRGKPLDDDVREWTCDLIMGKISCPPIDRKKRRGGMQDYARNLHICNAIDYLESIGVKPYENNCGSGVSGCAVVAQCMIELGFKQPRSYSQVSKIYQEYRRNKPTKMKSLY